MASAWGDSWGVSWADSWGTIASGGAPPTRERRYTYRPDLFPEEPKELKEPKQRKPKKLRVIPPKPSLLKLKPEQIEVKKDLLLEKIKVIGQDLSGLQITKGDRTKYNLLAKKKRADKRLKEYQQALEYYFELEVQKKVIEKDIIYVAMIMSEL